MSVIQTMSSNAFGILQEKIEEVCSPLLATRPSFVYGLFVSINKEYIT